MKTLLTSLFACAVAIGSWAQQTRDFPVGTFSEIEIAGPLRLELVQGSPFGLTALYAEELGAALTAEVVNGTLKIGFNEEALSQKPKFMEQAVFTATFPTLNGVWAIADASIRAEKTIKADDFTIKSSGAADVEFNVEADDLLLTADGAGSLKLDIRADDVELQASGACQVLLSGTADDFQVTASGAAVVEADKLSAEDGIIAASGASEITLHVRESLAVAASGGSVVNYRCEKCETVNIQATGSSSVKKY